MSNNNNDMDPNDDFDTDLGFEDSQAGEKKKNPLIKIGMIAVGLIAVVVAIFSLGGGSTTPGAGQSAVGSAPVDPKSLPAQKEPTPEYRQAMNEYNKDIIQKATETGQSAIPIPIDPARQQIVAKIQDNTEDPAERFRRIQEEYRLQQEQQQQQQQGQVQEADTVARAKAVQQLSQAMAGYATGVVNKRGASGMREITILFDSDDKEGDASGKPGAASGPVGPNGQPVPLAKGKVLLPATTIEYGQLLIEANTDAPGPVLALMVTGKLAGSRLLGSFQKTDEYLTLNFNLLITKSGKSIPISAIVLDPDTTLPGVITEIDRKYFKRIVIPAAANFISGVGSALAETQTSTSQSSSSTTTSNEDPDFSEAISQGISDSFDGISDAVDEMADNTEPMLRVAAGTPIGILFTQEVLEPVDVDPQQQQAPNANGNPYAMMGQAFYPFPGAPNANGAPGQQPGYGFPFPYPYPGQAPQQPAAPATPAQPQ